ncbi:hypothetical protein P885DRAFT_79603 [Corynascus similis CBS 632.67]
MCGPETLSATPRVGARVDLSSPAGRGSLGNLLFLNPSSPASSHATHVRFHRPSKSSLLGGGQDIYSDSGILVSIHVTGDLTKPLADAGLMQQFTLHGHGEGVETPLGAALSLQAGNEGIIGRRVSVRQGDELLADGIVGFNFSPAVVAAGL